MRFPVFSAFNRHNVNRLMLVLAAAILVMAVSATPSSAAAKFAAIAIDARSGKVLFAKNGDARRYPASLTKIMTLYLLFEEIDAGRLRWDSHLKISAYAASRQPSKLGLKAGSTIAVRDAVLALITKSANDIASAVAENISGSEAAFARRMTGKARQLGMTRTVFANASGLPNAKQVTTARDMATLALRIQRDFPRYFKFFATKRFRYGRRRYTNYNRLLGRVKGVDGIKTGYTRASGYNLTSSVRRGKKRIVAVVLGARSGRKRNAYMTRLIGKMFRKKLTSGTRIALVAGTPPGYVAPRRIARAKVRVPKPRVKPVVPLTNQNTYISASPAMPVPGSTFKAVRPQPAQPKIIAASAVPLPLPKAGALPKGDRLGHEITASTQAFVVPGRKAPETVDHNNSWNIQIGAFPTRDSADLRIQQAIAKGISLLNGKRAFTMKAGNGGKIVYRARFSGFDNRRSAKAVCRKLSRKGVGCFALAPRS